jgi:hypothetical protein
MMAEYDSLAFFSYRCICVFLILMFALKCETYENEKVGFQRSRLSFVRTEDVVSQIAD